jgi:hypothetical protein
MSTTTTMPAPVSSDEEGGLFGQTMGASFRLTTFLTGGSTERLRQSM